MFIHLKYYYYNLNAFNSEQKTFFRDFGVFDDNVNAADVLVLLRNGWGRDFKSDFSKGVSRDGQSFSLDEDDISVVTLDKKVLGVAIGIAVLDLFGDVVTSVDGEGVVNLDGVFEDVVREQVNIDVDFTSSSSSISEFNSQGVADVS